jgi:hypothetical protein
MTLPDLTNLTLAQLIATLLFFATIDTVFAYIVAAANGNFQAAYALDFLRTHVLKAGVPIALLAIIGTGVPQAGIPAVPPAFAFAVASLGIYALTVIASVRDTWADKAQAPTATSAISPTVEPPASLSKG